MKIGSLKPSRSFKIAKFVGSAAASGEISELSGSMGESLEAKKIIALMASAIGIMIAIRRITNAISFFSLFYMYFLSKTISGPNFSDPLILLLCN